MLNETKTLDIKEALKTNIVALRKKKGMSQAKLADLIGKSVKTVNEIEGGKTWPDHTTVKLIAQALDVGETDLFNDPGLVAAYNYQLSKK
jgi:transcriptional regulator with XRE-family HTH domain